VQIDPSDLEITVARASGPAGRVSNTTDSAVQIVHKPTGLLVTCADERSQLKNKAKAMTCCVRVCSRSARRRNARNTPPPASQIGTGDRQRAHPHLPLSAESRDGPSHRAHALQSPQIMEGDIGTILAPTEGWTSRRNSRRLPARLSAGTRDSRRGLNADGPRDHQEDDDFFAGKGVESRGCRRVAARAHPRLKRMQLYLQFERPLTEAELEKIRHWSAAGPA